jgi:hypothetical protein
LGGAVAIYLGFGDNGRLVSSVSWVGAARPQQREAERIWAGGGRVGLDGLRLPLLSPFSAFEFGRAGGGRERERERRMR